VDNDSFRVHYPDRYLGYLCVVSVIWTLLCASVTVVVTVVVTVLARGVVPCVTVRLYNRTHTAGWCRAFFVVCPFVLVPCGKRCGKPSGSTNGSGANNRGLLQSRQRLVTPAAFAMPPKQRQKLTDGTQLPPGVPRSFDPKDTDESYWKQPRGAAAPARVHGWSAQRAAAVRRPPVPSAAQRFCLTLAHTRARARSGESVGKDARAR
jgi:hypothetical protein